MPVRALSSSTAAMIQKAMVMPRSRLAKPCRQQRRNVIKAIVNSGSCAKRMKLVASEIRFAQLPLFHDPCGMLAVFVRVHEAARDLALG